MAEPQRPAALVVSSIVPFPPHGGGEKRTLRLLEAMVRAGASPHLITVDALGEDAKQELGQRGITAEGVGSAEPTLTRRAEQHLLRRPSPYLPALGRRIAERTARRPPAFVQFEHTQNSYYHRAVRGSQTVLSLHNVDSELIATLAAAERPGTPTRLRLSNRRHAMQTTERRAARRADAVICVSEHDLAHFEHRTRRTILAPNGVDEEMFEVDPKLPESESVLFVGKYDYPPNRLGIMRFLREGWPQVARERPNAVLRLVGSSMSRELAEEAARSLRVEAVGQVALMAPELAASRVVVVPIWQGGGTRLKVLEALAAARPIAGTSLGVSGLGFVHRHDGLVADHPEALAASVVTLLQDPVLAGRLAAAGRRLADRYRWSVALRPSEHLYTELLEREL